MTPPHRSEFTPTGLLNATHPASLDGTLWYYDESDDKPYRVLDVAEAHNWYFAAVLAAPDGTYEKLLVFHDSDDYHHVAIIREADE